MNWSEQRRRMVDGQLRARGIRDERVLRAMLEIPREEFIPESHRFLSYVDEPAPIGYGQTISQPYITALMVQCLHLTETATVLEVGAGCGYHAAVLGAVAARVITIEVIPELAAVAASNLKKTERDRNVQVVCGDGSEGWAEFAPYDAISVAAAASEAPAALFEQLRDPGTLVIPVGSCWDQELRAVRKEGGEIRKRILASCRFVPLRDAYQVT